MSRQTLPSETEERILPSTNERKNMTISLLNQQAPNGKKTNCFSNPFSPLQESPTQPPGNSKLDESKENPPHHTVPPYRQHQCSFKAIFLCDSNGIFLDTKQVFSSKQEVP